MHKILFVIAYTLSLMSFLYIYILPFNFGIFEENVTMVTRFSLLSFSPWYYLLDAVIILLSVGISYLSYKKNNYFIPIILLFFYSFETINTAIFVRLGEEKENVSDVVFSSNNTNIIVFIQDAVGEIEMSHALTNIWTDEEKEWLQDFTYYPNTVPLSLGGTLISMPSITGGYKFASQYFLDIVKNQGITINSERAQIKTFTNAFLFFHSEALHYLSDIIQNKASIYYKYIRRNLLISKEIRSDISPLPIDVFCSPILAVSLYTKIPYFLRHMLVDEENNNKWNEKLFFSYRWARIVKISFMNFINTEKPVINYIHTDGIHTPFVIDTNADYQENLFDSLDYSQQSLKNIITELKKRNLYDTTKIIMTSDHGAFYTSVDHYIKNQMLSSNDNFINFVKEPRIQCGYFLSSYFLVKDFETSNSIMKKDNRFLSTGDTLGMVVNSIKNYPEAKYYTKISPPKRIFNIPSYNSGYLLYFFHNKKKFIDFYQRDAQYIIDENIPYAVVSNATPLQYSVKEYKMHEINHLLPFEKIN